MKRAVAVVLVCVLALSLAPAALAQDSAPQPVVRMGDWVEIGDELFVNFIASVTGHYQTTTNLDFEGDVQDGTATTDCQSSSCYVGQGDHLQNESRFGVDLMYKKNLKARVLYETQGVYDGSNIDGTDTNTTRIERFEIHYKFANTPFRMTIGAWLYGPDIGELRNDDDPGLHLYAEFGNFEFKFGALIEESSSWAFDNRNADQDPPGDFNRYTNDNNNIHYEFLVNYESKPHRFCLCVFWDRDRMEQGNGQTEMDYIQVMPGWEGSFGPIQAMAQAMIGFGTAKDAGFDNIVDPAARPGRDELDIFTWGFMASAEIDLGKIRPILGIILGSGDDDPNDDSLNGYSQFTTDEVTAVGEVVGFDVAGDGWSIDGDFRFDPPAQAPIAGSRGSGFKTSSQVFLTRIGWNAHADVQGGTSPNPAWSNNPLSNPGTLKVLAGLKFLPIEAHEIGLWYVYGAMLEPDLLTRAGEAGLPQYREAITGNPIDFSGSLTHEIGASWTWSLNKHFQLQPLAFVVIPDQGAQDIASTVACGMQPCEGEDVAIVGRVQFRATF
jgi:hypothetical protein